MRSFEQFIIEMDDMENFKKQVKFNDYVFQQKFGELQREFGDLTFVYDEKTRQLQVYIPIAPEQMDPFKLIPIIKKYFPKFTHSYAQLVNFKTKKAETLHTFNDPEHFDSKQVFLAPPVHTGYHELGMVINDFENQNPTITKFILKQFQDRGLKLGDEADNAYWASQSDV